MTENANTTAEQLIRACEIGRDAGLRYIYAGNLPGRVGRGEYLLPVVQRVIGRALRLFDSANEGHRKRPVSVMRYKDSRHLGVISQGQKFVV